MVRRGKNKLSSQFFFYMKPNKAWQNIFREYYFGDLDDVKKYASITHRLIGGTSSNKDTNDDSQSNPKVNLFL